MEGDSSGYTHMECVNCTFVGGTMASNIGTANNGTYHKINLIRCLKEGRNFISATNALATDSYYFHTTEDASVSGNNQLDPHTTQSPFLRYGLNRKSSSVATAIATNGATGEQTYDIAGNVYPGSNGAPGCLAYDADEVADLSRTASSDRGATKLWSSDYPLPENVTEDDTVQGVTGTYHEATVAEVQDGVMFGAASALEGTYAGGGGGRPEIRGGNL
jgi:hypothetical protein